MIINNTVCKYVYVFLYFFRVAYNFSLLSIYITAEGLVTFSHLHLSFKDMFMFMVKLRTTYCGVHNRCESKYKRIRAQRSGGAQQKGHVTTLKLVVRS